MGGLLTGIPPPTLIELGTIVPWDRNFSNLAKQFMTSKLLFKYDVISDFHYIMAAKIACHSNFIVIPSFLNDLSSHLVQDKQTR